MTENDKKLIELAHRTPWDRISGLEPLADTEEAREELRRIARHKYHYEEYKSDMI